MLNKRNWLYIWNSLIGKRSEFSVENRAFNAISVITLAILIIILPINTILGLQKVEIVLLILIVLQSIFYYWSRVQKRYVLSMFLYVIVSYITLFLNFFFNSGSQGPTIFLCFLTFQLIVAFAPTRQHLIWLSGHVILVTGLLGIEHYYPERVPDSYLTKQGRVWDLLTAYAVILVCMYFVTSYLRNNYNKEKKMANNRSSTISEKNRKILQQNAELDKLNNEKSKLLSIIAHDLKQPLNSITTITQLLMESSLSEEEQAQLKMEVLAAARNTSDMLANMQSWTADDINILSPQITSINLSDKIAAVVNIYKTLAERKDIAMAVSIAPELSVKADESMLQLVLRNVISNAVKFTPEQGNVSIEAETEANGKCLIIVRDTGIGMSSAQILSLFDLNIHPSYGTNNEAGLSLGLQLTKEYVQAMGGKIWVESLEGTGSSFFILLDSAN